MAENKEELSAGEAAELDELLDGDEEGDKKAPTGLKKVLSNKILLGGVFVLLIAIGVGVYFFISEKKEEEVVPVSDEKAEEVADEGITEIKKVHIYKLEPFFFPIRTKDQETGRFISVSPNLLLSNNVLAKNIDNVLPILRNSIYAILRRKKPDDFTLERAKTEEKLKKEILTASNALLLSGAGTVTDVFFSNFMIK